MPTEFLKDRMPEFQQEVAGETTISYYKLKSGQADAFTGTIDDATAYSAVLVALPALINYSPSDAMRQMIGATIEFEAAVMITTAHLTAKNVTLAIGDKIILPVSSDSFFVTRIVPTHQVDDGFLQNLVVVSRRHGRR